MNVQTVRSNARDDLNEALVASGSQDFENLIYLLSHDVRNSVRALLELGLFENWERFSKGDIYCNIGWGGSQKYFNKCRPC